MLPPHGYGIFKKPEKLIKNRGSEKSSGDEEPRRMERARALWKFVARMYTPARKFKFEKK